MKITIKLFIATTLFIFMHNIVNAQTVEASLHDSLQGNFKNTNKLIEIRAYNLKPGTRNDFNKLFVERSLPLLKKWNVEVIAFGPSLYDSDSYFLIRSYKDLQDMQQSEDSFYGSDDWKKGPREAILALIVNFTTTVMPANAINNLSAKLSDMENVLQQKNDISELSRLNALFIKNFVSEDVAAHNEIIHKDFVCIKSNGAIVPRDTYMKNWATDFKNGRYTSFDYTDEHIRIFGNMALVRAKTVYTKMANGKQIKGFTIYIDTYIKENGKWKCVQAQITPTEN